MKRSILALFIAIVLTTCNEKPILFSSSAYRIFPNPFLNNVQIQFANLPNGTLVKLKALDVKGKKVFEESFSFSSVNQQFNILFPGDEEGNCFIEIEIDGVKFRDKIVKLKP